MTSVENSLAPFYSLQQTVSAVENGGAFGGQGYDGITLEVAGIVTNDIVQLQAKNDDALAWVQVGSNITANGFTTVPVGYRYYRAAVTNNAGGGTISAVFVGG